jgi:hypothetical protein
MRMPMVSRMSRKAVICRLPPTVVLGALLASVVALALAPLLMPESYSWQAHTTSESAAQGVPGAWVARLGFIAFGLAVVGITIRARQRWPAVATAAHGAFGALMCGAAVFSSRSWEADAMFSATEDVLHSVAATGMGFAFALGVVALALGRAVAGLRVRVLDVVAVGAAVILPLAMMAAAGVAGLLQRAMFAIAYLWYVREALLTDRRTGA